jgi:hypothetical protein
MFFGQAEFEARMLAFYRAVQARVEYKPRAIFVPSNNNVRMSK